MDKTLLKKVHTDICNIVNQHDGLWRKVAELTRKREHLIEENPFKRLLMELDVIEENIGQTDDTRVIRATLVAAC